MGFLVPLAAAAVGSFIGKKVAGGGNKRSDSSNMTRDERRTYGGLDKFGNLLGRYGHTSLGRAERSGAAAEDYYGSLLGEKAQEKMEFFAPEIAETQSQFDQALAGIESGVPRGGERNRALSQARLGRASSISSILSGARPAGAKGLMGLTELSGNQGIASVTGGAGARSAGLDFLVGLRGQQTARRGQNLELAGSLGESIGGIIAGLLVGGKE
tara:strand:- start:6180 stop:6821 length:642 start_codon:yes stop_codon:yes gene_type:complete